MVPCWLLVVLVPHRLHVGVCWDAQQVLSIISNLPGWVLGEGYHIPGSTEVTPRPGAWCKGSCWREIGKSCTFFFFFFWCVLAQSESDSRNSCMKFISGAVLFFFFFVLALNMLF